MGLMDKFKNLFTDEEIIEEDEAEIEPIEIKEIKKEEEVNKLPTFMREKIEKEEQEKQKKFSNLDIKKESKLESILDEAEQEIKKEDKPISTFKFPIDITDNDFIETRSRQSVHNKEVIKEIEPKKIVPQKEPQIVKKETKVAELYKDKKKETPSEAKKFRATPIISPIYGILDKNYTPTDVETNKGINLEETRHSKNVDFDSVRKKAYGNLSDEIKENLMCENCEYLKEAKQCQKEQKYRREEQHIVEENLVEENLVYDVLEDNNQYMNNITLDEATENYYDYGVEYEKQPEYYQQNEREVEVQEDVRIVNHEEQAPRKKEIPPVKSSINLLSTLKKSMGDEPTPAPEKNLELTDDLFNLIDSMYDERNDS